MLFASQDAANALVSHQQAPPHRVGVAVPQLCGEGACYEPPGGRLANGFHVHARGSAVFLHQPSAPEAPAAHADEVGIARSRYQAEIGRCVCGEARQAMQQRQEYK